MDFFLRKSCISSVPARVTGNSPSAPASPTVCSLFMTSYVLNTYYLVALLIYKEHRHGKNLQVRLWSVPLWSAIITLRRLPLYCSAWCATPTNHIYLVFFYIINYTENLAYAHPPTKSFRTCFACVFLQHWLMIHLGLY